MQLYIAGEEKWYYYIFKTTDVARLVRLHSAAEFNVVPCTKIGSELVLLLA